MVDLEAIKQRNLAIAGAMVRTALTAEPEDLEQVKGLVFDDVPAMITELEECRTAQVAGGGGSHG